MARTADGVHGTEMVTGHHCPEVDGAEMVIGHHRPEADGVEMVTGHHRPEAGADGRVRTQLAQIQ
jgi:hypothetical protein